MNHVLVVKEETDVDVLFECATCGAVIGFNKPGIGEPSAELIDGVWRHPDNPEQWMGECAG